MATSTMPPAPALPIADSYSTINNTDSITDLHGGSSSSTSPSWQNSNSTTPTILEEVEAAQQHLRSRLAGALTRPPAGVPESSLPSVPLIDIGPSFDGTLASRQRVAQQIREACLSTGFFQIANHGVTPAAMAGVLKQAERFFHDLPEPKRQALHIKHSRLFRGYEPHDFTYVNPDDQTGATGAAALETQQDPQHETKEGFNWGYEESLDPTGGDGKYVELDGTKPDSESKSGNVWPDEADLPGFRDAVAEYYGQVLQLARHLFRLFALSLGLEETYFDELMTHPGGIARLLYYKGLPAAASEPSDVSETNDNNTKLGLGAHTDYECFTLLLSSTNPGLEILFPPSSLTQNKPIWRSCPVRPGTLTVNVADFLMRWTNGLYKSTVHRVVSRPGAGERYSVPFFFSINYDADVLPLPESAVGASNFLPLRAGEYVLERLRATQILADGDADGKRKEKDKK
ncbi:Clavaminate synthase-like protein, partial [Aureobasidium melanogenum]